MSRKIYQAFLPVLLLITGALLAQEQNMSSSPIVIAIHGGAGTILKENLTPELEQEYRAKLEEALRSGHTVLTEGGSALDAVVTAIAILEDSPLFNAGKGAVFTSDGHHELDASIMDGATRNSGAVAGVKRIKNPILLARAVMEKSPHVLLAGDGAEAFARDRGFSFVENDYFYTEKRYRDWLKVKDAQAKDSKFGTVGAVALDCKGHLAAGTSTGGMTNKQFGRIGDSPIIGAGTYAEDGACAVSATGHGEYFIRGVIAFRVAAKMLIGGVSLEAAADSAIYRDLEKLGGTGGIIALDGAGNVAMPFNTKGMYRGFMKSNSEPEIFIYGNGNN